MQSLEGYRLLDFGTALAGPQVGQLLADLGMEVIKIETRIKPDGLRLGRPIVGDDIAGGDDGKWLDMQPMFHVTNRNKLSFTINLKQPGAMDVFTKLVKISDVVLDNSSPGVMGRLGLDQASLEKIKKDIISVSLSGCGEIGPLKDTLVYAPLIIALGGLEGLLGYYGDTLPMNLAPGYGDTNASMHGAVTNLIGEAIMDYNMNGRIQGLQGNRHPVLCPHGNYPCQGDDKWVTIAVDTETEWQNLCNGLGAPEWLADKRFANKASRRQHWEELDKLIAAKTMNYGMYDISEILQKVNVAATPVMNCEDQFSDPHFREREVNVEIQHPIIGTEYVYNNPMRLSDMPPTIRRPAPSIGEHNDYVLKDLLGYSATQVADLVAQKIIL
jgi:crotonobetainyl-CoA:carnitine CoA-transferase CaiB-like acyl-CoA transferase